MVRDMLKSADHSRRKETLTVSSGRFCDCWLTEKEELVRKTFNLISLLHFHDTL